MGRRYLVTGGAGFIGSNFIRRVLETEDGVEVTNLDALAYSGVQATVDELNEYPNHHFALGDIRDPEFVGSVVPGHDVIVHFAAESHVDRSIQSPADFLETNVVGTGVVLDAAFKNDVQTFVHVSTDEVYGSIDSGFPDESASLNPSSPYSASKAGSDLLALSYAATYGYRVILSRCTNNFGPYQFPEKAIPRFVTNLIEKVRIPLYGDGTNERDWIHVDDHNAAVQLLVEKGVPGEIYNIGAGAQIRNVDLAMQILDAFSLDESWIEFVPDRPGHDHRYAVDSSKMRSLGWTPQATVTERLHEVIDWYRSRPDWWRPLRSRT